MKSVLKLAGGLLAALLLSAPLAVAQDAPKQTLFTNVNVFDGFGPELQMGMNVLVEDNYIKQVSAEAINAPGATVIDGAGRTMTPGLIDMHQHVMLNPPEGTAAYQTRWDDAAGGAIAIHNMNVHMLQKGITTVRDIAGDPLDIAKAIDMGLIPGPRVVSSGGAISRSRLATSVRTRSPVVWPSRSLTSLNRSRSIQNIAIRLSGSRWVSIPSIS